MRLKRVGCHTGIITPNFVKQDIAGNDTLGSAVKKLQNICFFLRQANFLFVLSDEHFVRRLKRVWSKIENGVF